MLEEVQSVEVFSVDGGRRGARGALASSATSSTGVGGVIDRIETVVVQEVVEVQVEGLDSLRKWLDQVEREVSSSSVDGSSGTSDTLHRQQTVCRGYLSRITAELGRLVGHQREMRDKMEATERRRSDAHITGNMKEVSADLTEVINRCESLQSLLEQKLADVGNQLETLEHHHEEIKGLQTWLAEVKVFLKAEEDQVLGRGDVEILKAQLQQSNVSHGYTLK